MTNENKDMKKKATVVGAIALSAVLAGGIGYTSYNLLKDKANEQTGEEVKSNNIEETETLQTKVIPLKFEDELDYLITTAIEIKVPIQNLFDEKDDYSDLENAIANAEKYQVKNHAFFEEEDEFKELNESFVTVATEKKKVVKENDVAAIEPVPLELAEIDKLAEAPIQVDEPKKPVFFEDIVAIAKPSEPILPIVPGKPSQHDQLSESIDQGTPGPTEHVESINQETPANLVPVISDESSIPVPVELNYPETSIESSDPVTPDIPTESVEPIEDEKDGNPSNPENTVAPDEESVEPENPTEPSIPEYPMGENPIEPSNSDDVVTPEEPTTPTDQSESEIPSELVEPESPTESERGMNPEISQETIEPEVPTEPIVPKEPVEAGTPFEPELPAEVVDSVEPAEPEENSGLDAPNPLEDGNQ
ncbi:hypothetical protein ACFPRA_22680 [Sporosarcina soli]|uniref:Uncharacterized protein n=1 Tax=Sporosarcina soli TaxID=334736 RepID=A0ABW0TS83_9BACL